MNQPPQKALAFLRWFCRTDYIDEIEGDLIEIFRKDHQDSPRLAAWKFRWRVLKYFRPEYLKTFRSHAPSNPLGMYQNYLKTGWRNLLRNKGYSLLNISGLVAGMTVALLIGIWTWDELSFNSQFENHPRLAQILVNQSYKGESYTGATVAAPVAFPLSTNYPDDIDAVSLVSWNSEHTIALADKKLSQRGLWVQPAFPHMFSLSMISGSRDGLKDPSTLLLSRSAAVALFGDVDPLNRTLRLNNAQDMTVGGVFEDFPRNSTFGDTRLLLPWDNKANRTNRVTDWHDHSCQLFVLLADNANLDQVNEKIKSLPTPYFTQYTEEIMAFPFAKLNLYDRFEQGRAAGGRIEMVRLVGITGALVLALACINFMNLSTARSDKRAKEVGIRKAIGSLRQSLMVQFLSESLLVVFAALVFSYLCAYLSIPLFNTLADKEVFIPWNNPYFWLITVGLAFATGIISGSYPAFYLSSFKPVAILKGSRVENRSVLAPRRILVVFQFAITIGLMISTVVFYRQIQFARERQSGFSRDGLLTLWISDELQRHFEAFRQEALHSGLVETVALASQSPAGFNNNNGVDWPGKDPGLVVFFRNVDVSPDFGKAVGWNIVEGRDFTADFADSSSAILSEAALKVTGLTRPIGEVVTFRGKAYTIVGIAGDMITQSPYDPAEPAIFTTDGWKGLALLKMNPEKPTQEVLEGIQTIFQKHTPSSLFNYSFVDTDFARKFSNEERVTKLATFFALLAAFISCLGLLGLSAFMAEQRTKEIGIRKVLGASTGNLYGLLSRDFLLLVLMSSAVAVPLAYYFLNRWLQTFPYHMSIAWWMVALAVGAGLLITLLTVSFQTLKVALSNPVESLRSE